MKPFYTSVGSNYAEAQNSKYYFYYGHEAIADNNEWLFIVRKGDKKVFELTNSQLMELCDTDTQSPESMLLTGILAYLSK